ncbi:MAG: helix-turn-helix domain-containing protein [Actinomycetota bacterium]|nr:helix-turn-helix domain-containing protein [Actinomycetota bacterium]
MACAAQAQGISRATAHKWLRRYQTEGEAGSPPAQDTGRGSHILRAPRLRPPPATVAPSLALMLPTMSSLAFEAQVHVAVDEPGSRVASPSSTVSTPRRLPPDRWRRRRVSVRLGATRAAGRPLPHPPHRIVGPHGLPTSAPPLLVSAHSDRCDQPHSLTVPQDTKSSSCQGHRRADGGTYIAIVSLLLWVLIVAAIVWLVVSLLNAAT